jgi:hypothetical protein
MHFFLFLNDLNKFTVNDLIQNFKHQVNQAISLKLYINHAFKNINQYFKLYTIFFYNMLVVTFWIARYLNLAV